VSGVGTVEKLLAEGALCAPMGEGQNAVDLVRAIASLCGAAEQPLGAGAQELASAIGLHDHIVLVLVDGLGAAQLDAASGCGFLASHRARTVRAVFPSTTAAALTTLASGRWPAAHGVLGWWLHLEDRDLSITSLPFVERSSGRPLDQLGVAAAEVFPFKSILPGFRRDVATLIREGLVESVYTRHCAGGTARIGYASLEDAFTAAARRIETAPAPSFTYLYLPHYDALCHEHGVGDPRCAAALSAIDAGLAGLAERCAGRARLVVTADHGLVDVPDAARVRLCGGDPLLGRLCCPPSGERRVPFFHVRAGEEERFADEFSERAGERFALLTSAQAADLGLLGPSTVSGVARSRLGTFVGIPAGPAAVEYEEPGAPRHIGLHGGLSPEEMNVPLALA
jgi:hypothetical protein